MTCSHHHGVCRVSFALVLLSWRPVGRDVQLHQSKSCGARLDSTRPSLSHSGPCVLLSSPPSSSSLLRNHTKKSFVTSHSPETGRGGPRGAAASKLLACLSFLVPIIIPSLDALDEDLDTIRPCTPPSFFPHSPFESERASVRSAWTAIDLARSSCAFAFVLVLAFALVFRVSRFPSLDQRK